MPRYKERYYDRVAAMRRTAQLRQEGYSVNVSAHKVPGRVGGYSYILTYHKVNGHGY